MYLVMKRQRSLFARVKPKVEALDLPEGYSISWGGEYESLKDAQESLFGSLLNGLLADVYHHGVSV